MKENKAPCERNEKKNLGVWKLALGSTADCT